jgi:hypothetical protein
MDELAKMLARAVVDQYLREEAHPNAMEMSFNCRILVGVSVVNPSCGRGRCRNQFPPAPV